MNSKIEMRDPVELRLHKLQKYLPAPNANSGEWHAFVDSIKAGGILHALIITSDGFIMDGGWRWRAAKQLQLTEVPCVVRDEAEAAIIITESLLHRKQMTRGAAVYLALGILPDFVAAAEQRRLGNLRRGVKTSENPLFLPKPSNLASGRDEKVDELCSRWGVSDETYRRARQVHDIFTKNPDIKSEWEPRLLSGEKNLWNVLSAVGGAGADQSKRDKGVIDGQLELFSETFSNLQSGGKAWGKFNDKQRDTVLDAWRKTAAALPQDLRSSMRDVLDELES